MLSAEREAKPALLVHKCETDFVGSSDAFLTLGQELADLLLKDGEARAQPKIGEKLPAAIQKLGENISLGEMHEVSAPVVATYIHSNRKIGVIVGAEQVDRAKAKDVAMHAAAMNPLYVHPDEVSADVIAKEREIWAEQMKKDNKPAAIMEKIMLGKEKKFREENALTHQPFVKDPNQLVHQYLGAKITSYVRIAI